MRFPRLFSSDHLFFSSLMVFFAVFFGIFAAVCMDYIKTEGFMNAAEYNRWAIGNHFSLIDLPPDWPGTEILRRGDLDEDQEIEFSEEALVDWTAFSQFVAGFQGERRLTRDGKLGPITLAALRAGAGMSGTRETVLTTVGGVEFRPAENPLSEPENKILRGENYFENTVVNLWNNYGGAIAKYATAFKLPIKPALAVFVIESGKAYDANTGLLMIQYEDHVFYRVTKQGRKKPRYGSQAREWQDLTKAASIDPEAAFDATSGGLAQIMGFNAELIGYKNAKAMFGAFQCDAARQVESFFAFVDSAGLSKHIKTQNWYKFARGYNGPGKPGFYATMFQTALHAADALEKRGAVFAA